MNREEDIDQDTLEQAEAEVRRAPGRYEQPGDEILRRSRDSCPACSGSNTSRDVPWSLIAVLGIGCGFLWLINPDEFFSGSTGAYAGSAGVLLLAAAIWWNLEDNRFCRACGTRFKSVGLRTDPGRPPRA